MANFLEGWAHRRKVTSQAHGNKKWKFEQPYAFKAQQPCSPEFYCLLTAVLYHFYLSFPSDKLENPRRPDE